jgi:hypothetical protein
LKTYLNADPQMNNTHNDITNEIHTGIEANGVISLGHDIYFGESVRIVNVTGGNVPLTKDDDYTFEEKDDTASGLSGKDCFRKIKFSRAYSRIKVNYHAYGDFFKATDINELADKMQELVGVILPRDKKIIRGNGTTTMFIVNEIPDTASDFEFKLNIIPLETDDYTWNFSGTSGTLTIRTFIPLSEDVIEITYRS